MAMRLTSVDEYQFLVCLKNGVWGAKTDRFKNWEVRDILIFSVDKRIAALAEVMEKDMFLIKKYGIMVIILIGSILNSDIY